MMKRIMVGVCYACNCKVGQKWLFRPGTRLSYSLKSLHGNKSYYGLLLPPKDLCARYEIHISLNRKVTDMSLLPW